MKDRWSPAPRYGDGLARGLAGRQRERHEEEWVAAAPKRAEAKKARESEMSLLEEKYGKELLIWGEAYFQSIDSNNYKEGAVSVSIPDRDDGDDSWVERDQIRTNFAQQLAEVVGRQPEDQRALWLADCLRDIQRYDALRRY